ncbi:MAG: methyltransferase, partial [Nonlabens ulvanivorans]
MYEHNFPHKRFNITLEFLEKHISKDQSILDLGVENPFSKIMKDAGYDVQNTSGTDLDDD